MRWLLFLLAGCSLITDPGQFEGSDSSRTDGGRDAGDSDDAGEAGADAACGTSEDCDEESACVDSVCTTCDGDDDTFLSDRGECADVGSGERDCNDSDPTVFPQAFSTCAERTSACPPEQGGEAVLGPYALGEIHDIAGDLVGPKSTFGEPPEYHGDLYVAFAPDGFYVLAPHGTLAESTAKLWDQSADLIPLAASGWPWTDLSHVYEACMARSLMDRVYVGGVGVSTRGASSGEAVLLEIGGTARSWDTALPSRSACAIDGMNSETPTLYWTDRNLLTLRMMDIAPVVNRDISSDVPNYPLLTAGYGAATVVDYAGNRVLTWDASEWRSTTGLPGGAPPVAAPTHSTDETMSRGVLLPRTSAVSVVFGTASGVADLIGVPPLPARPQAAIGLGPTRFLVAVAEPDGVELSVISYTPPNEGMYADGLMLPELADALTVAIDYREGEALIAIIDSTRRLRVQRVEFCDPAL